MFSIEQLGHSMHIDWAKALVDTFNKPEVESTLRIIKAERKVTNVYPSPDKMFRVLKNPPSHYTCLILGQSPYHYPAADGYAFSSGDELYCPESLSRIIDAIADEDKNLYEEKWKTFSLERWVDQGVLLLNVMLSTDSTPLGHSRTFIKQLWREKYSTLPEPCGWEYITAQIIKQCFPYLEASALWGTFAHEYQHVLKCPTILAEHPVAGLYKSPQRKWQHNNSFKFINTHVKTKIEW